MADLRRWSEWMELVGLRERTRRMYRYWLLRFQADTVVDPDQATEDDIVAWLASMPRTGPTRRSALQALRSYYRWRRGPDPTERLHVRKAAPQPAPYLDPGTVAAILRAAFRRDPRRGWSLLLLATTGVRVGSLVALEPGDVDLAAGTLHIRVAKAGRTYVLPLTRASARACAWLAADAEISGRETLVGVGEEQVRVWLRQAALAAGVRQRVWPHLLRHTVATQVARVTDVETLRQVMGWSDLSMVPIYVHSGLERRREALAAVRFR
jgi:integrase